MQYIVVKGIVTASADERDKDDMTRQVILEVMHNLFLAFQK